MEKFDFSYNRAWKDGIRYRTLISKMESGKEQRRGKGVGRRRFKLTFEKDTITSDDAQDIWDFFIARKGRLESFLWDYKKPDGSVEEVTVRFDMDFLERDAFLDLVYEHGVTLIEVI
ncbi:MAG: DUF2460 domain-containing protein [Bacteroidota bacterium]